MTRDKKVRLGCDRCKRNHPTYRFTHVDELDLWLCDTCLAVLLDWPAHHDPMVSP